MFKNFCDCISDQRIAGTSTAILNGALAVLDKDWGVRVNTYTSCYKYSQITQTAANTLDTFFSQLRCSVWKCDHDNVQNKRFEETMLTQQLNFELSDSRVRDCLLIQDADKLLCDMACDMVRARVAINEHNKLLLLKAAHAKMDRLDFSLSLT
ncbi:unnamed protein product [Dicrocoelium dendriticum]|nr:unnamed protein product [Dicrocoelium dendriticum]